MNRKEKKSYWLKGLIIIAIGAVILAGAVYIAHVVVPLIAKAHGL